MGIIGTVYDRYESNGFIIYKVLWDGATHTEEIREDYLERMDKQAPTEQTFGRRKQGKTEKLLRSLDQAEQGFNCNGPKYKQSK